MDHRPDGHENIARAVKRKRNRYEKSTRGCYTCKVRRVKCDETFPQCVKCASTGRRCEGPQRKVITFITDQSPVDQVSKSASSRSRPISPTSPTPSASASTPDSIPSSPSEGCCSPGSLTTALSKGLSLERSTKPYEERRAFAFFIEKTAPILVGVPDLDLWGCMVPQVAQVNDVVWDCMLTIACLFEHPLNGSRAPAQQTARDLSWIQARGLKWYQRAIARQRAVVTTATTAELILTCTMFLSIEMQKCNYQTALRLIQTGFSLIAPLMTEVRSHITSGVEGSALRSYMRNSCFINTSHTAHVPSSPSHDDFGADVARTAVLHLVLAGHGLIKELYISVADHGSPAPFLTKRRETLVGLLDEWQRRLDVASVNDPEPSNRKTAQCLLHYCRASRFWLSALDMSAQQTSTPLAVFDTIITQAECLVSQFQAIRQEGGSQALHHQQLFPTWLFDIVLLPPLYFTVTLCLDLSVRDRAFRVMAANTSQRHGEQLHGLLVTQEQEREQDPPEQAHERQPRPQPQPQPQPQPSQRYLLQLFQTRFSERGLKKTVDVKYYDHIDM